MKKLWLFSAVALVFLGSASPPPMLAYAALDLASAEVFAPTAQPSAPPPAPASDADEQTVEVRLDYADPATLEAPEVVRWDQLSEPVVVQSRSGSAPTGTSASGPVRVVVSLPQQKAFVYRGSDLLWTSPVSTGKRGHSTPTGTFPILQKKVKHNSNLYNNAPMPFMQRLTHSGVAIHAGHLPGYRASHGCIRMPWSKAKKLFGITRHGTPVIVTDQPVTDTA